MLLYVVLQIVKSEKFVAPVFSMFLEASISAVAKIFLFSDTEKEKWLLDFENSRLDFRSYSTRFFETRIAEAALKVSETAWGFFEKRLSNPDDPL